LILSVKKEPQVCRDVAHLVGERDVIDPLKATHSQFVLDALEVISNTGREQRLLSRLEAHNVGIRGLAQIHVSEERASEVKERDNAEDK
jgi:hypothetical protein